MTSTDIADLIQQFPQLASQTDNHNESLGNLNADNLAQMISSIDDQIKTVTSDVDIKAFESLKDQLIKSVDLSGISKDKVASSLRDLFYPTLF